MSMPIFVYEPDLSEPRSEQEPQKDCCYFETLQWANEAPLKQCPECGGPIRRAVTSFATTVRTSSDPLSGVARKLGEGLRAGQDDTSAADKSESRSLISGSAKDTPAGRAARLAYKHVCSGNCRH